MHTVRSLRYCKRMRKLTYYVGSSLDGFIAGPDGEIDFYPLSDELLAFMRDEFSDALPTHVRRAFGIDEKPNRRFDTLIMGRGTYEPALRIGITSPYAHLRQYVVSRTLQNDDPAVSVVTSDPLAKVRDLKAEEGGLGILLAGGGKLAGALLPEIDELVIKLYPVVAGRGVPMIDGGFRPTAFDLADRRFFENGTTVLTFRRN